MKKEGVDPKKGVVGWSLRELTHPDSKTLWCFLVWKSDNPNARGIGDGELLWESPYAEENRDHVALTAALVHRLAWLLSHRDIEAMSSLRPPAWAYMTQAIQEAVGNMGSPVDLGLTEGAVAEDGEPELPKDRWFVEIVKGAK